MGKWLLLFSVCFSLTVNGGNRDLPLPLPDEAYPEDPNPNPAPPPRQEVMYTLGQAATDRFGSRTFEFYPRADLSKIVRIRLVGTRNNLEIKDVRIKYADNWGDRRDLQLPGDLKSGGVRLGYYEGRSVFRLEITASASYFWKKPGGFRVDVVAER